MQQHEQSKPNITLRNSKHKAVRRYYNFNDLKVAKQNIVNNRFFWPLAILTAFFILILFYDILMPFIIGILIAYFLNPLINMLNKVGISRFLGTLLITLLVLIAVVLIITVLLPILTWQLQQFVTKALPTYIQDIQDLIKGPNLEWVRSYARAQGIDFSSSMHTLISSSTDVAKTVMTAVLRSGKSIVSQASVFIVAPVVAFYTLIDWDRMVATVDSLIPRRNLCVVRSIIYDIDRAVAGFVRGQATVCLILAIYYAFGLSICGLNYAILIGLYIGFASFIPYIGTFSGFLLALFIAWVQFHETSWYAIGLVLVVFAIGHFIEAYILQPKLVGNSIGLHPVWLMFALFAFAYMMGFLGMLIAVPAAAALGVLVRYMVKFYKESATYNC